jgi:hypothetical protein
VREVNRLHKVLEDGGVKLAVVASDMLGVSGRAMLEALLKAESYARHDRSDEIITRYDGSHREPTDVDVARWERLQAELAKRGYG